MVPSCKNNYRKLFLIFEFTNKILLINQEVILKECFQKTILLEYCKIGKLLKKKKKKAWEKRKYKQKGMKEIEYERKQITLLRKYKNSKSEFRISLKCLQIIRKWNGIKR